jgi:hypothetical protein
MRSLTFVASYVNLSYLESALLWMLTKGWQRQRGKEAFILGNNASLVQHC